MADAVSQDLRRSRRYTRVLLVELLQQGQAVMLQSVDVGRHGLFVTHPKPPKERQVVMLNIHLPDGPIRATAMITRRTERAPGGSGMGLQFFTLAEDHKARWDRFIAELDGQRLFPKEGTSAPRADVSSFYIKPRDVSRLTDILEGPLRTGAMELGTPVLRPVGSRVNLVVVHPRTQEEFTLVTTVFDLKLDRPKRMLLQFQDLTPDVVRGFAGFIETGLPAPSLLPMPPPGPPAPRPPPMPRTGDSGLQSAIPVDPDDLVVEDDGLFSVEVTGEHPIPLPPPPAPLERSLTPGISLPVVTGALLQSVPAHAAPPPEVVPPVATAQGGDAVAVLYGVADKLRADNLQISVKCLRCTMPEARQEVGAPPGVMALFAQMRPHWCPHCTTLVTGLRVDPNGGRQRLLDLLGPEMLPLMMSNVPLSFVFDALTLAQPPRCAWCGGPLLATHATSVLDERLWWMEEGDTVQLTGVGGDCCEDPLWEVQRLPLVKAFVPLDAPEDDTSVTSDPAMEVVTRTPHLDAFLRELEDHAPPDATAASPTGGDAVDAADVVEAQEILLEDTPATEAPPLAPDPDTADGMRDGFLVFNNRRG
jgi:hypothetical protein